MESHCLFFRRDLLGSMQHFDGECNASDEVDISMAVRAAGGSAIFDPACTVTFVQPPFPVDAVDRDYFLMRWDPQQAEQSHRRRRAEELTRSYSKKAMLGAMAAITPGSDLVIQGYLGVSLVRALAKLYEVPVRGMDTDLLMELVQTRVARSTTIMLAVAGNALKAFPGVGTLVGGITHAAAYGMIFEALGKAVAASLESRGALRPAQAAQVFEENLSEDLEARARRFARLALEIQGDEREEPRQAAP